MADENVKLDALGRIISGAENLNKLLNEDALEKMGFNIICFGNCGDVSEKNLDLVREFLKNR